MRGLTRRFLEECPDIEVVTTASNGKNAVDAVKKHQLDVIVLDIEMPIMDGITAIPLILAANPSVKIVMSSTLAFVDLRAYGCDEAFLSSSSPSRIIVFAIY